MKINHYISKPKHHLINYDNVDLEISFFWLAKKITLIVLYLTVIQKNWIPDADQLNTILYIGENLVLNLSKGLVA